MGAPLSRKEFLINSATGVAAAGLGLLGTDELFGSGVIELAQAASIKRGGTLVIGQDTSPNGIDPAKGAAFSTLNVTEQMYTGLLNWNNTESKIEPDLATSWTMLDHRTFLFNLRKDVKFHNGEPLTSEDVAFTFQRIKDPKVASPWQSIFDVIDKIATPDPHTAVFHLKTPFSPLLNYLATVWYGAIENKKDVQQRGNLLTGGAGTGPFMLEKYVPDVEIKLRRNPHYYEKGLPYLDGLDLKIIPDEATRVAALRDGTVDMTWVFDPRQAVAMQSVQGVHVSFPKPFSNTEVLEFDQTKAPYNDVRVRRAFSLTINREQIRKTVMLGHAGYGTKIAPYEQPYAYTSAEAAKLPYFQPNLPLAKKLMAEAGYARGFDTVMEISPQYYQDVPTATIIQQQVAQIGIRIHLQQAEWTKELSDFIATKNPLSMIGTIWQPDPDASVYDIYYSKSPINLGKWSDSTIDHLLELGRTTYSIKKRVAIYRQIERIVADKVYLIFPFSWASPYEMWRTNVHGYIPMPGGHRVYLKQTWKG